MHLFLSITERFSFSLSCGDVFPVPKRIKRIKQLWEKDQFILDDFDDNHLSDNDFIPILLDKENPDLQYKKELPEVFWGKVFSEDSDMTLQFKKEYNKREILIFRENPETIGFCISPKACFWILEMCDVMFEMIFDERECYYAAVSDSAGKCFLPQCWARISPFDKTKEFILCLNVSPKSPEFGKCAFFQYMEESTEFFKHKTFDFENACDIWSHKKFFE